MRDHVCFYLNGSEQIVRGDRAFITLTEYLRLEKSLVGTKVVCAEGDCGACTVLVGRSTKGKIAFQPIDACIQFLFQLDGTYVVTVEGLGSIDDLHRVQRALVDCHGSQCGYCTPGFVMALAAWANDGATSDRRIALTGNLCRCTGYVPILEAAAEIAKTQCPPGNIRLDDSILAALQTMAVEPVQVVTAERVFFAPITIEDAIAYKTANPEAVIVAGATELGVLRNKRGYEPIKLMSLSRIPSLDMIEATLKQISFGANVTWSQVEEAVRVPLPQFRRIVERFGSPQIRNAATLVGNIAHGSPIADSLPLLLVMDAAIEIVGPRGSRRRSINGFYTGYKQLDLHAGELITRVTLPLPEECDRLRLYKVSRRTDLDIATFGAAIRLQMDGETIRTASLAYSGVAPTVVRLPQTEANLSGRPFNEATFRQAGRIARAEVTPITDVRGSSDFRLQLCENVLRKFYFDDAATPAGSPI